MTYLDIPIILYAILLTALIIRRGKEKRLYVKEVDLKLTEWITNKPVRTKGRVAYTKHLLGYDVIVINDYDYSRCKPFSLLESSWKGYDQLDRIIPRVDRCYNRYIVYDKSLIAKPKLTKTEMLYNKFKKEKGNNKNGTNKSYIRRKQ